MMAGCWFHRIICGFILMLMGVQVNGQRLFPMEKQDLKKMHPIEITNDRRAYPKSYLYELNGQELKMVSLVSDNQGFNMKLYAYTDLDILKLDKVKVTKRKEQSKFRLLGALAFGTAGFFMGRTYIKGGEELRNPIIGVINPPNSKIGQSLAGGVIGVSLGLAIGGFLGERTFYFKNNPQKTRAEFEAYVK